LLAVSFLVHFEVILLLPVVAYLSIAPLGRNKSKHITHHAAHLHCAQAQVSRITFLWPSVLIFIPVIASFYGPFLLHPNLKHTGSYLENRIGGGSLPPFNNLDHFFYFEALKYNSVYYMILFNVLLLVVVGAALVRVQWRRGVEGLQDNHVSRRQRHASVTYHVSRVTLSGVVILILIGTGLASTNFQKLSASLVGLGLAIFLLWVIISPYTPSSNRILWVWIAPPFYLCFSGQSTWQASLPFFGCLDNFCWPGGDSRVAMDCYSLARTEAPCGAMVSNWFGYHLTGDFCCSYGDGPFTQRFGVHPNLSGP
jgi:hypothetical protein